MRNAMSDYKRNLIDKEEMDERMESSREKIEELQKKLKDLM